MKITVKENNLINSTPEKECWLCNEISENIICNGKDSFAIDDNYLSYNSDIREHLKQLIGR